MTHVAKPMISRPGMVPMWFGGGGAPQPGHLAACVQACPPHSLHFTTASPAPPHKKRANVAEGQHRNPALGWVLVKCGLLAEQACHHGAGRRLDCLERQIKPLLADQ